MDKRIALVTGGTGGIGTAIAQKLSKEYQVIACYYNHGNHDLAKHWQKQQQELGHNIDILYANVCHFEDCETMAAAISERYGRLDVLVNNAGITADTRLKNMTVEQWQSVLNANLTSVFNVTRNILPLMLEQKYGRIISISSINGQKGQFGQCNYAATKAAMYGFTKSLAQEVAKCGITANTISPGYTETPMLSDVKEEVIQAIIANIPVGRLGQPEDIARTVQFLASPDAGFITGTNIDVNGGQYM